MSEFDETWGNYLLKELIETELPEWINFLPQTKGWLIVGLALLLFVSNKIYLRIKLYRANAYRREAMQWLDALPHYTAINEQPIFRQLPGVLREIAMCGYDRKTVIPLFAKKWEEWLDNQCEQTSFSENCSNYLSELSYAPNPSITSIQMKTLTNQVKLWVKFHRVEHA